MVRGGATDRGQTAQDFALGMAIFLLTAAFVFAFLPTLAGSYGGPTSADGSIADRALQQTVGNVTGDAPYTADSNRTVTFFEGLAPDPADALHLDGSSRVNVTVVDANRSGPIDVAGPLGESTLAAGPSAASDYSASRERPLIITGAPECDPVCYLVVRVW